MREYKSGYYQAGSWLVVCKEKPKPRAKTVRTGTRTHFTRQLLAHGPLTFSEFVEITGWPVPACRRVLSYLVDDLGEVSRCGGVYRFDNAEGKRPQSGRTQS